MQSGPAPLIRLMGDSEGSVSQEQAQSSGALYVSFQRKPADSARPDFLPWSGPCDYGRSRPRCFRYVGRKACWGDESAATEQPERSPPSPYETRGRRGALFRLSVVDRGSFRQPTPKSHERFRGSRQEGIGTNNMGMEPVKARLHEPGRAGRGIPWNASTSPSFCTRSGGVVDGIGRDPHARCVTGGQAFVQRIAIAVGDGPHRLPMGVGKQHVRPSTRMAACGHP